MGGGARDSTGHRPCTTECSRPPGSGSRCVSALPSAAGEREHPPAASKKRLSSPRGCGGGRALCFGTSGRASAACLGLPLDVSLHLRARPSALQRAGARG